MAKTDLRFDVSALDRASQVFTRMGRAVESFERRLERLDKERVSVDVEVGTEKAERQIGAFATDMQARLRKAIAALPDIELDADSTAAQRDIARIRAALLELSQQTIGVDIDAADAEARMRLLQAELAGLQDNADIQVRADATQAVAAIGKVRDEIQGADREVGQFARNLQRDVTRAVESLPDIELDADADPVHREVARIRGELAALADQRIGIDIDTTEAHARASALEADLRRLGDVNLDVQMRADVESALAALAAVNGEVDRLDGRTARVKIDVDKSFADTIVKVAALGRALGMIALPAAAIAAAPQLASLGAAAIQAAGAVGLIPAAGAAAALAITTVKLAVKGFGDAVTEQDPKKAAEALKALAPPAREAAVQIRALRPAWDALQLDVQGQLFDGVGRSVTKLAAQYLPQLRTTMGGVADSLNNGAKLLAEFLNTGENATAVQAAMRNVGTAIENVVKVAVPLGSVFVDVLAEGAVVLRDLTAGAGGAAQGLADMVREARASGELAAWIRGGVEQVQQLGRIARDAGITLYNVFQTADDAGGGFLTTLEDIVAATREWTSSAQGQDTLTAVFRSIREAADAAAPGVRALVDAVSSVIQRLGDAGVLRAAGEAFSAIAAEVAPLVTQLGNLAPVVTTFLGVVRDLAPVLIPAAAAVAGFWAASKLVAGISSVTTAVSGFVGSIRSIGTVDDATGKVRTLAGVLGSGGILGIALAAAGVALSLWAGAQADAAQAVADHKARIDELKGTLDQYTGAVTEATVAQRAQELSTKTLADGHTTFLQAVKSLGISTEDYTQATLGNADALGRVQSQLDAHVRGLIAATPQYKDSGRELANLGLSLDDLSAAAQGNGPAMDRINDAISRIPSLEAQADMRLLIGALLGAGGGAAELSKQLGISNGDLAQAQQQVRDAAEASGQLAKQLGEVKTAMDAVPGAKEVVIKSTSPQVIQQLRDLGFEVTQLKDGTVRVNLDDAEARANFDALMVTLNTTSVAPVLDLNTATAQQKADAVKAYIDGLVGIATADANAAPGTQKANDLKAHMDGIVGILTADANPAPGTQKANDLQAHVNALVGIMTQDADNAPGTAKGDALRAYIDGLLGVMEASANTGAGTAEANALKAYIDRLRAAIGVSSNASQVDRDINNAARDRTATIQIKYAGVRPGSAMGIPVPQAGGGVLGYAGGGFVPGKARRSHAARGMVIPGYAPGRDEVPIIASRGEAVLVPELTRALGARRILQANAAASGGRPATVVGRVASMMDGTIGRGRAGTAAGGAVTAPASRQIWGALDSHRQAPVGPDSGPGLAQLRSMVGLLRSLRGDVDQGGYFSALIGELRALRRDLAGAAPSYADTAKDAALLGGASWR